MALVLALAAVCLVAGTAPAPAATKVRSGVYKLALPAPGHATVAAVDVTVRKHGRGRLASRLSLSLPNRFALPNSVRFFYARRRITVSPLRYELLLLAINRASGHAARTSTRHASRRRSRRAHASRVQFNGGRIVLHYPSRPAFGHSCGNCAAKLPVSTNCKRCWFKRTTIREAQVVNADTASATDLAALTTMLRSGWTSNGDTNTVFGNPGAGTPRDPTLNGGHYDDNRAFGWDRASLRDPGPLLHTVVDDLLGGQPGKIIGDLELIGQADLNANGVLDSATTPGGGTAP